MLSVGTFSQDFNMTTPSMDGPFNSLQELEAAKKAAPIGKILYSLFKLQGICTSCAIMKNVHIH